VEKVPKKRALVHFIADHPKLWGMMALVALAVALSGKMSHSGIWICLSFAWILGLLFIREILAVASNQRLYTGLLALLIGVGVLWLGIWLVSPTTPTVVHITFKESPLFTNERKRVIVQEMTRFRQYLVGLGFDVPVDTEPMSAVSRGPAGEPPILSPGYGEELSIDSGDLDNPEEIRNLYSSYVFNKLFAVTRDLSISPAPEFEQKLVASMPRMGAAYVFSKYFTADYVREIRTDTYRFGGARNWIFALWEMRRDLGRDFTNHSLLYTHKFYNDGEPIVLSHYVFDIYFRERLLRGTSAADNNNEHKERINAILRRNHLDYNLPPQ
jgi:hypothetical protein